MTDITSLTARFVALTERERALKAELSDVEQEKSALEPQILDYWANNDIEGQRVHGNTLYVHTQTWASHGGDPQRAVAAMRAAGLDDLITVNSQTLSAYVRECLKNGEAIPPEIAGSILVTERTSLRVRKS